jgi:hypothetical protein
MSFPWKSNAQIISVNEILAVSIFARKLNCSQDKELRIVLSFSSTSFELHAVNIQRNPDFRVSHKGCNM